jgi:SAM-dependent methyltransferase
MYCAWYELLAYTSRDPAWRFMNFGYQHLSTEINSPPLFPEDELDRLAIQLYQHVIGVVELGNRDVLEVGCGRGGGCWYVSRYYRPRSVTGVDLSKRAVALCSERYSDTRLCFRQGDAEAMPFANRSFDVVLNVETSHCCISMQELTSEVFRVLRNSGYYLFADLRPAELIQARRDQLLSTGLRRVKENTITANVLAALRSDNDRKEAIIRAKISWPFRGLVTEFAGLKGTAIYNAIRERRLEYVSYVLWKEE